MSETNLVDGVKLAAHARDVSDAEYEELCSRYGEAVERVHPAGCPDTWSQHAQSLRTRARLESVAELEVARLGDDLDGLSLLYLLRKKCPELTSAEIERHIERSAALSRVQRVALVRHCESIARRAVAEVGDDLGGGSVLDLLADDTDFSLDLLRGVVSESDYLRGLSVAAASGRGVCARCGHPEHTRRCGSWRKGADDCACDSSCFHLADSDQPSGNLSSEPCPRCGRYYADDPCGVCGHARHSGRCGAPVDSAEAERLGLASPCGCGTAQPEHVAVCHRPISCDAGVGYEAGDCGIQRPCPVHDLPADAEIRQAVALLDKLDDSVSKFVQSVEERLLSLKLTVRVRFGSGVAWQRHAGLWCLVHLEHKRPLRDCDRDARADFAREMANLEKLCRGGGHVERAVMRALAERVSSRRATLEDLGVEL